MDPYLTQCTAIDPADLTKEFVRVPSDLAYWNEQYSQAYKIWLEAKAARELIYAQAYEARLADMSHLGKRPTVSEIESSVIQDANYTQAKMEEIATETEKVRLYGVLDSLRSKRDMLISLGAQLRAEMQHDPMIRQQAWQDRQVSNNQP